MTKNRKSNYKSTESGRMWAGIIIVGFGVLLLADRLHIGWFFPSWLFSWPIILIVIGLIIGGNSNFKNPASFFLLFFGSFFLLKDITHFNIGPFLWPAIIIGLGLWLLLGKGKGPRIPPGGHGPHRNDPYSWDKRMPDDTSPKDDTGNYQKTYDTNQGFATGGASAGINEGYGAGHTGGFTDEDYMKSTAIFSEERKTIISKNFLGGEIVNIFGGTDINLMQADINTPVVIDIFQIFAGTKIIVPSHWKIKSEVVSVFGEVVDRRFVQGGLQDDRKTLYIKGTSIFGGVTIKNI